MSTTLQALDARAYLQNWLQYLVGMYSADVNATPEDKWTATFGGCTRTCAALSADAISLIEWTTLAINGQVPDSSGYGDYLKALTEECGTRAGTVAKLTSAVGALNQALNDAGDETLAGVVTAPFGIEMPLFMIAQIAASHIWYHDGQLNYVQCLLGDDKVHWMAE